MRLQVVRIIAGVLLITLVGCSSLKSNDNDPTAEKNKKLAEINVQLGMAYLSKGNVQRAKQKLLIAMQKDPKLPEVWYSMGYFQETTGNIQEAQQYYLKSVQLAPKRGDVLNNYGTFLCRTKNYSEAIKYFILATQDKEYLDTASAYENAGLCALTIPDRKMAAYYFKRALEQDPMRMTAMNELTNLKNKH